MGLAPVGRGRVAWPGHSAAWLRERLKKAQGGGGANRGGATLEYAGRASALDAQRGVGNSLGP
eukprot:5550375-Pyramimonas_sp.AAC.1